MSRQPRSHPSALPPWTATNSAGYASPGALAVDVVVLTVRDRRMLALSLTRSDGQLALPGGLVGPTESPAATADRKLREKTGLREIYLEQLATFAMPDRDPRGWIPSVAHLALVPPTTDPADPDARWIDARNAPPMAFDHSDMLHAALERVLGKLWWSNIAVGIFPASFTLAEARDVYDAIADTTYDPGTFARDLRATGLIAPTGQRREGTGGRPAALYTYTQHSPAWGAGRRKRVDLP